MAAAGSVGATADESPESPGEVASDLTVVAALAGSIDDGGRSQALAASLERLRLDGAVGEVDFVTATGIDSIIGDGLDLLVIEGEELGELVAAATEDHPDVAIAWATAADAEGFDELADRPNVAVITAAADQGGYVFGEVAAALADGGSATVFSTTDVGTDRLFGEGFAAGFAAGGGADVVAEVVDGAVDGPAFNGAAVAAGSVRDAVDAAAGAEVPFFYDGYDLNGDAELVVASLVYRYDAVLAAIVSSLGDGSYDGGRFELELANQGVALVFNDAFDLDAAILAAAGETFARIEQGMISTDGSPAPAQQSNETPSNQTQSGQAQNNEAENNEAENGESQNTQSQTNQAPATTQPATTQPATTQPATTQPSGGSCQGMGRGPANDWRAELGRAPLSGASLGSCSWARQLAANGSLSHGASWEVVYYGPTCGGAWSAWRNSGAHYDIIVDPSRTAADFQCYVDGNGTAWAVGRLS